jgi:hypothetical protein
MVGALSVGLGLFIGGVDLGFARRGWGGAQSASRRFFTLFFTMIVAGLTLPVVWAPHLKGTSAAGIGMIYWVMAGFAFCAPLDVRTLDVKPAATMRWSWRQALDRGLVGLVGTSLAFGSLFGVAFVATAVRSGWKGATDGLGGRQLMGGFAVGIVLAVLGWWRLRPQRTAHNVALGLAVVSICMQIGLALASLGDLTAWAFLLLEAVPAVVIGVFGGFASTMIDPARGRNAGAWFWLRVPVLMFFTVGLVMLLPGIIGIYFYQTGPAGTALEKNLEVVAALGAGSGLVAFFRFGGFNGVQHFFLRWLLVRSGDLPPQAEKFFNHTVQLALMQKVGFGYRFIHALLLDHLAERPAADRRAVSAGSR